jgi:hypothetical protein
MAGGGAGCGAEEAREVGGEPDMRGRPGSEWGEEEGKREGADERAPGGSDCKKKKRGEGEGEDGPAAGGWMGRWAVRERKGVEFVCLFFFKLLF